MTMNQAREVHERSQLLSAQAFLIRPLRRIAKALTIWATCMKPGSERQVRFRS
jgi:hypothetical protein